MTTLLITIHLLSCIMLILVVLLQAGRGADMGAAFGGASTPMFGSGSSTNPLARVTTITAVMFLTTALFLAVSSARRASVFDNTSEPLAAPPRAESTVPVIPQPQSPPAAQDAAPVGEAQPLTIPANPSAPAASDPLAKEATPPAAATGEVPPPAAKDGVPTEAPPAANDGAPTDAPPAAAKDGAPIDVPAAKDGAPVDAPAPAKDGAPIDAPAPAN